MNGYSETDEPTTPSEPEPTDPDGGEGSDDE